MIFAILALGFLAVFVPGAISQPGYYQRCPKTMETVPNFNAKRFSRVWYEQARYFEPTLMNTHCVTTEFIHNKNGTITIRNRGYNKASQTVKDGTALARIPNAADASKFRIIFPAKKTIPESDYWIVATDYENYAVAYSCKQLDAQSTRERAWILTKKRNPSQRILVQAKAIAKLHGIDRNRLLTTNQIICWS